MELVQEQNVCQYMVSFNDINELYFKLKDSNLKTDFHLTGELQPTYANAKKLYESNYIYACQILEKGIFKPQNGSANNLNTCPIKIEEKDSEVVRDQKEKRKQKLLKYINKIQNSILDAM